MLVPAPWAPPLQQIQDRPFVQELHVGHALGSDAENDVRSIAIADGRPVIATAAGVRVWDKGWTTPPGDPGSAFRVHVSGEEVWIGAWNGLHQLIDGRIEPTQVRGVPIRAIGGEGGAVFAGGPDGLFRIDGSQIEGPFARSIQDIARYRGDLWLATHSGLWVGEGDDWTWRIQPDEALDKYNHALTVSPCGQLWVSAEGGLDVFDERGRRPTPSGLPHRNVRALAFDERGHAWIATALGVSRWDGHRWALRHGRRWSLSDDVRDLAIAPDGAIWLATAAGVSQIRRFETTLEAKARRYQDEAERINVREPGLVGPALLTRVGDLTSAEPTDTDNDGLFTGTYLAGQCYRYAATGEPEAKAIAHKLLDGLLFLQTVTGTEHFVARTALPKSLDPRHDLNRRHDEIDVAERRVFDPRWKAVEDRWNPTPDGEWLWKRDTSSDEITGHVFALWTYHRMCADESEKPEIARAIDRIVGGIVDAGYVLRDIDGEATRWAVWSPEALRDDPEWVGERGTNSVEIVAFLVAALEITGDEGYRDAIEHLMGEHGYGELMQQTTFHIPSTRTHIDHHLLSLAYPMLMSSDDPRVLEAGRASMERWWEDAEPIGSPLHHFVYASIIDRGVDLRPAAFSLRDWPWDTVVWGVDQSGREDVSFDRTPGSGVGQLDRYVPPSERELQGWDQNPRRIAPRDRGLSVARPDTWLLPYWMGVHHGFVAQD